MPQLQPKNSYADLAPQEAAPTVESNPYADLAPVANASANPSADLAPVNSASVLPNQYADLAPADVAPEGEASPGVVSRVGTRLLESLQSILDVGSGRGFGTVPRTITSGEAEYKPHTSVPLASAVGKQIGIGRGEPVTVNPPPASLPGAIGAVLTPSMPLITASMLAGEAVAPEAGLPPIVGGLAGALGPTGVRVLGRAVQQGQHSARLVKGAAPAADDIASAVGAPVESRIAASVASASGRERVAKVSDQLFTEGGVVRDPKRLAADQIADLVATDKLSLPQIQRVLTEAKVTPIEFANSLFLPGTANATTRLEKLGAFSQRVGGLLKKLPEEDHRAWKDFAETSRTIDEWQFARSYYQRGTNLWRGLLVSQPATAIRNLETQLGRLPLDALVDTVDRLTPRWFGGSATKFTDPWPSVEAFFNVFRRGGKAEVDSILKDLPDDYSKLFGNFAADVSKRNREMGKSLGTGSRADRLFTRAEDSVDVLNTLNQLQEFHTRRAVFLANHHNGKSVAQSIDKALEVTFAQTPKSETGKAFVELVNKLPGAAFAIPFPRFLANSLKFSFDYSPGGFLKLLTPNELRAIGAGDSTTIAKATVGTGMLYTAYQLRDSKFAGEKWYEVRLPGTDRLIDARPFAPFSAYLFVADWLKRRDEGTLPKDGGVKDAAEAIGLGYRGPAPLDLIKEAITEIRSGGESGLPKLEKLAGQVVGGLATPLQTIKDLLNGFEASPLRDTGAEPLLGPTLAKVPTREGDLPSLPAAVSATSSATPTREAPLLRQLTGISLTQPKNAAEKELARLGYSPVDVFHGLGNVADNRTLKSLMGPLVEQGLSAVVESPGYKSLSTAVKKTVVDEVLKVIREASLDAAEAANPDLAQRLALKRVPRRIRDLLAERNIQLRDFTIEAERD